MIFGSLFGSEPSVDERQLPLLTADQQARIDRFIKTLGGERSKIQRNLGESDPSVRLLSQEENAIENLGKVFKDIRGSVNPDTFLEGDVPIADFSGLLTSLSSLEGLSDETANTLAALMQFASQAKLNSIGPEQLDDANAVASTSAGALINLLTQGPQDFEEFFQRTVVDPGRETFEEDVLPALLKGFSGEASFGGERRKAVLDLSEQFQEDLLRARADLAFRTEEANRQNVLAGLGVSPAVQGLQRFEFDVALDEFLANLQKEQGDAQIRTAAATTALAGIDLATQANFSAFDRELAAFEADQARKARSVEAALGLGDTLTGLAIAPATIQRGARTAEQGQGNTLLNQLISLLTQQRFENVVTVDPGSEGILSGLLGGVGKGAGGALGSKILA